MLSAQFRLRRPADFRRIKALGRSFFSGFFTLKLAKNTLNSNRFAVVISTQISKRANQRNRLRRQLREIIRLYQAELKTGYDAVIYVRPSALGKDYAALKRALLALLAKAKLNR